MPESVASLLGPKPKNPGGESVTSLLGAPPPPTAESTAKPSAWNTGPGWTGAAFRLGMTALSGAEEMAEQYLMTNPTTSWTRVLLPKGSRPSQAIARYRDEHSPTPSTPAGKLEEGGANLIAGGLIPGGEEEQAAGLVENAERAFIAKEAHSAGAKLSPAYIGRKGSQELQTLSGQPSVHAAASKVNEDVADRLVKAELGLHPDEDLSETTFQKLKDAIHDRFARIDAQLGSVLHDEQFHQEVREAGGRFANRTEGYGSGSRYAGIDAVKQPYIDASIVRPQKMLDEARTLRSAAKANLKNYDPEKNAIGLTQRQIAEAIESQLHRHATSVGRPDLTAHVKDSYAALAKIHAVEDAMGAGGHVRTKDLARMHEAGVPLTGNLLKVARMAKEFPKDFQPISEKGMRGEFSAVDYLLGGSGVIFGHPLEVGLALARPVARHSVLSKPWQRRMVRKLAGEKSNLPAITGAIVGGGSVMGAGQEAQDQLGIQGFPGAYMP